MKTSSRGKVFWYPEWSSDLKDDPLLGSEEKSKFQNAIIKYLSYLKKNSCKVCFESAKSYLATLVGSGVEIESERMGLRCRNKGHTSVFRFIFLDTFNVRNKAATLRGLLFFNPS